MRTLIDEEIKQLATERNLVDAGIAALSPVNRFDVPYRAIMQCAMIGLRVNGYRTFTSQLGHHQTALQVLPKTLQLSQDRVIVLGVLCKQGNLRRSDAVPPGHPFFTSTNGTTPGNSKRLRPGSISVSGAQAVSVDRLRTVRSW